MQPCAPRKFNILVAALKTPSDPSRGTIGNPTVSRTGFTLQQTVLENGTTRIGGPVTKPPAVGAANHTAAIKVVTALYFDPLAKTASTGTLTFGGAPVAAETVTIGGKPYTFRAVIDGASVDGDVLNEVAATDALDNLIAAIMLGAGGGVKYAAAMTLSPTVTAAAGAGDTMVATAKVLGDAGAVGTTSTVTLGTWAAITLTGQTDGTPPPFYFKDEIAIFDRYVTAGEEFGSGLGTGIGPVATIATQLATALNAFSDLEATAVADTVYITSLRPDATMPIKVTNDESTVLGGLFFTVYGPGAVLLSVTPKYRQTYFVPKTAKTQSPPVSLP
jgi:hypothetical protein